MSPSTSTFWNCHSREETQGSKARCEFTDPQLPLKAEPVVREEVPSPAEDPKPLEDWEKSLKFLPECPDLSEHYAVQCCGHL